MAEYNDKIKILMLKGEKGDEYDDTELRAEIAAILANNAFVKAISDGSFELPIHTINDNATGNNTTWSSSKVNELITDLQEDVTTLDTDAKHNRGFGYVLKNPKLVHITKDALDGFSYASTLIATISASETEAYAYFQAYDEYVQGNFNNIAVPYNWNYTGTSYSNASERHDINAMEFILGDLKIEKDGSDYKLFLQWAYKSGSSYSSLTNGIYLHVYPFFRPLPTE